MKYRNILLTSLLVAIVSVFSSCMEDMDLPIQDSTPILTVEGSITTDTTTHYVRLSLSNNFYDLNKPQPVSDATVSLSYSGKTHLLTETATPGLYATAPDFYAVPQVEYQLDILHGDEHYWATSSCQNLNSLDSIFIGTHFFDPKKRVSLYLYMQDEAKEQNYYTGYLYKNDTLVSDTIDEVFFVDDAIFNGNYIAGNFPIFSLYKQGESENSPDDEIKENDVIGLMLCGIPKEYYDFAMALNNTTSANPLMGSPAGAPSNIYPQGKACGIFYVATSRHATTVYHAGK